jgi:outer membrane immunogenic protein
MRMMSKALLATAAVFGFASATQAADLMAPMAPAAAAVVAPTTSWAGPYVGANVGYGWGTVTPGGDLSGGMVGGQIGYNFYLSDNFVLGVQGDVDWANQTGAGATINWLGAVTGHVGFAWDAFMPYVLGGVAFANNTMAGTTNTQTGWTVGGGAEVMLADNLSAFAEYRYSDYGTASYGGVNESLTDNTVRVGLNFHF